ncbi:alkaline shock response membrane anchor protein AmaP [Candidatus Aerophobetes bacterium]|uniref:Alkaline shock response membrane anchor protein AmaP n=1 Tax=Aerophobetes bacterium TaxID=2030807 RepID=A0A662D2T7_UNCAE|nr:MAG: alkaline shock response membrane anchor protein AmaP [Candidatus Aerophobetes bacterium]
MRIYQKVLWGVGLVALGAFSLAGFLADTELISQFVVYLALRRMWDELIIRTATGVVFLFLLALSIYLPISTWLKGGLITLSNPLGPLNISTKAISKFIQRIGKRTEEVKDVRIRIKHVKEGVESYVTLSAHGEVEGGIPHLINDFQEMVKKYLMEQVGVPDVKKVEVKVTKIF